MNAQKNNDNINQAISVLRSYYFDEIEQQMNHIEGQIKSKFADFLGKFMDSPIIKQVFNLYLKDLRVNTKKQVNITLDCAREYDGQNMDTLIEKHFKKFLKFDLSYKNLKKT